MQVYICGKFYVDLLVDQSGSQSVSQANFFAPLTKCEDELNSTSATTAPAESVGRHWQNFQVTMNMTSKTAYNASESHPINAHRFYQLIDARMFLCAATAIFILYGALSSLKLNNTHE